MINWVIIVMTCRHWVIVPGMIYYIIAKLEKKCLILSPLRMNGVYHERSD